MLLSFQGLSCLLEIHQKLLHCLELELHYVRGCDDGRNGVLCICEVAWIFCLLLGRCWHIDFHCVLELLSLCHWRKQLLLQFVAEFEGSELQIDVHLLL